MTIPPHVMAELLKTAQHNEKDVSRANVNQASEPAKKNIDPNKYQISAQHNKQTHQISASPGSQSVRTQYTLQPADNCANNRNTLGQLSLQGHFPKTEDRKQTNEQQPVTVFRPIAPKNKMEYAGTLNKAGNPPDRMHKSVAPASIIKSESQPIILTHQHQILPVNLLHLLPQNSSHSTPL